MNKPKNLSLILINSKAFNLHSTNEIKLGDIVRESLKSKLSDAMF